jgi:hypothetical protein
VREGNFFTSLASLQRRLASDPRVQRQPIFGGRRPPPRPTPALEPQTPVRERRPAQVAEPAGTLGIPGALPQLRAALLAGSQPSRGTSTTQADQRVPVAAPPFAALATMAGGPDISRQRRTEIFNGFLDYAQKAPESDMKKSMHTLLEVLVPPPHGIADRFALAVKRALRLDHLSALRARVWAEPERALGMNIESLYAVHRAITEYAARLR